MKITEKISGWGITDIDNIKPINDMPTYEEFAKFPPEVKNGIVKGYNCFYSENYVTWLDSDDVYKIAIYLNYPEELAQLKEYFGDNWYKYYLRFNH